jgi:hypothetical protein
MITSKQIIKLSEEYLKTVKYKYNNRTVPVKIYENPTSQDFVDLNNDARSGEAKKLEMIRFIVDDDTKNIYMWDGYYATHYDIARSVLGDKRINDPGIICGIANSARQINNVNAIRFTKSDPKNRYGRISDALWIQKYLRW